MALTKCKECGHELSKKARQCPSCGAPVKKRSGCLKPVLLVLGVFAVIGIVSSIVAPSDSNAPPSTPTSKPPHAEASKRPTASAPETTSTDPEEQSSQQQEDYEPLPTNAIDLITQSGITYEQCTITRVSADGLSVKHTRGITTIPFADLNEDFRKRHGLTEERLQAYRERVAAAAARRKEAAEKKLSERQDRIESGFSAWDGSHIQLARVIKKSMNDPKSYKHDETVWWDRGDHLIVRTSFRGKNAFGGVVLNWVKAKCDLDGNVIEVIEQGP